MTQRPTHHSLTFWLGIIILVLLAGAWRRSIHRIDVAGHDFATAGPSIAIGQGGGKVALAWSSSASTHFYQLSPSIYLGQSPFGPSASYRYQGLQYIRITFAHWFIILIFFLCWLLLLASRHERTRAQEEAITAAEDDAKANAKPNTKPNTTPPP